MAAPIDPRQIIMMCRPTYFEPAPAHPQFGFANVYEARGRANFERDPAGFREKSMEQWLKLRSVFARYADIIEIEPHPGMPDMVYTADASFSLNAKTTRTSRINTLMSRFTNPNRLHEFGAQLDALENRRDNRKIHVSRYSVEAGDLVYDPFRDIVWGGYHDAPSPEKSDEGRTDIRAHMQINRIFNLRVESIKTCKPAYHLDTTIGPLPRGEIIVNERMLPEGYREKFLRVAFKDYVLKPDKFLIPVPPQDVDNFVANIRCFGNTVVMPNCSAPMRESVVAKGYELITVDLSCFQDGGGSAHCLSNVINQPRVAGGYNHMGGAPKSIFAP